MTIGNSDTGQPVTNIFTYPSLYSDDNLAATKAYVDSQCRWGWCPVGSIMIWMNSVVQTAGSNCKAVSSLFDKQYKQLHA